MKETRIALSLAGSDPDTREILAPALGHWSDPPPLGSHLTAGASAGTLRVLTKSIGLVVPDGIDGLITSYGVHPPVVVEYGQRLLIVARSVEVGDGFDLADPPEDEDDGIPEGMIAVRSPTDGIFYRRPSPEEPSYVEEGAEIAPGDVLGLVEVMKCFNQITWRPEGEAPARATVAKVLAEDSAEVKLGDPLFFLENAT